MRQKHLKLFFAFSVLSILGCSTARIGAPDLAEKPDSATDPADLAALDTLLSELPAENAETAKRIFSDLLAMGPETLQILGRKLLPPGEGDDSRIRFAFAGLATAVQGSGRESDRRLYSGSLIRMLETESDSEIRAFLIGQLQWVGNDEAVPALAPYLLDKRLIDPAARALVTIGSPAAEKVLLKALKKNELPDTVAIVKALGELRSNAAAAEIKPYTTSADENLRLTALLAIANIGNPAAQPILERMVKNETPKNRAKSLSAYLLFARRLAESGDKEACVKICRDVMEWTSDPREIGARCTALSLLTDVLDSGALDDLLAAMDNENSVYRARALDLASVDPSDGATLRWIDQMESSSPETAAQILGMLGNRGDPTAMESALDALDSADPRIRLAAIPAAGKLGGGRALPGLVDILKEGRLEEIREVQAVLLSLPPSEIIPAITRVFSDMPVASRTAVVEILGERRAAGYKDLIWSQTESEDDSLRLAALVASEHLVETTDYAELVKKLLSAENPAESAAIQNAIVAVSAKIANPEEKILPLVEAFETAEGTPRIELMNAMSRIGGRKALDAVLAEGGSKDAKKRMWAVFALANWTDSGAVDELVDFLPTVEKSDQRQALIRGITRLVNGSTETPAEKLSGLQSLMSRAADAREKTMVLAACEQIPTMESLIYVATLMNEQSLVERAARSAAAIIMSAQEENRPLEGPVVVLILKNALQYIRREAQKDQIEKYIAGFSEKEDGSGGEDGFVPLFNGRDLTGWIGNTTGYTAEDGKIVLYPERGGGNLYTERQFSDFELFFEFRLTPGANNGLGIRTPPEGDAAYVGMELQILDDTAFIYDHLKPYQYHGSIYGVVPAKRGALNPVGEWNEQRVIVRGKQVTVVLNGVTIVDADIQKAGENGTMDGREHPGLERTTGHIGFLGHDSYLEFRRIRIREF